MSKPKAKRPKVVHYNEEVMHAACQTVRTKKFGLREAARLHGVPTSTLRDRLNGKTALGKVDRTVITVKEEERLVEWIKECSRLGFDRTRGQVQRAVQMILNDKSTVTKFRDNLPGQKWTSLFLKRHPEVSLRNSKINKDGTTTVTEFTEDDTGLIPGVLTIDPETKTANSVPFPVSVYRSLPMVSLLPKPSLPTSHPPPAFTVTSVPVLASDADIGLATDIKFEPLSPTSSSVFSLSAMVSSSSSSPTVTYTNMASDSIPRLTASTLTSNSTVAPPSSVSMSEAFERLLEVTAMAGTDGLLRYRAMFTLGTETDNPEEKLYRRLYSQLREYLNGSGTEESKRQTFDNIPLPPRLTHTKQQLLPH